MNPQIYVSTGVFKEKSLRSIIAKCIEYKIMNLELSSGFEYDENILTYVDKGFKEGMRFLVHNYFPPPSVPFVLNLASEDYDILKTGIEHCKRSIDLCQQYSAPFFTVHCGFAFHASPAQLGRSLTNATQFSLEKAEEIFVNSINALCSYAVAKNISVLIENNVLSAMNLIDGKNRLLVGVTADDLLRIMRNISFQNFGLLIDTGHLNVSADSLQFSREEFLNKLGDRVLSFHLNDNDGISDSNLPFDVNVWFIPFIKKYSDKTFVIESYRLDVQQILESIKIIEEAL